MITRQQVRDLRAGDVVRLTEVIDGLRYVHEGPVRPDGGNALSFADLWLRDDAGNPAAWIETLTVIERAPRPLYVNHDRTEPVPGDVVRVGATYCYMRLTEGWWLSPLGTQVNGAAMPDGLRLLVDGETGEVVP